MPDASRRQIHQDRLRLQNPYAHVHGEGELRALSPEVQEEMDLPPITLSAAELRGGKQLDSEFSKEEIEEIARKHQIALWKNKDKIWKRGDSKTPIEILDPFMALASIGYTCKETESLGQFSDEQGKFEVAAIIESDDQHVDISKQFPATVRKFTAAHELGHALLHNSDGLHRDRPLNGTNSISHRNRKEKDADKFATFFLMPARQVVSQFRSRFGSQGAIYLNQDTLFALQPGSHRELSESGNRREFARIVASTEQFGGKYFRSLADQFGVSTEAMAIRLEELDLAKV